MAHAVGIDIGGTGIKAAAVDTATGELITERVKLATPAGAEPKQVVATVLRVLELVGKAGENLPIGICFPAIVKNGRTLSASNVSAEWIGLEAESLFERSVGRDISFINDADAAGLAELWFGAAKSVQGLVILTTLGTGIGSAFIYDGVLVPNTELGHIKLHGEAAERFAASSVKDREQLSWAQWAERLQEYYSELEALFSPDLFVVGGGVSKQAKDFLPLLSLATPIVAAAHRNNAGIIGSAALAAGRHRPK